MVLYAVKANGHPAVVEALGTALDGWEVASGGELALALTARERVGDRERIAFGGPAKTDAELAAAVAAIGAGVDLTINVESAHGTAPPVAHRGAAVTGARVAVALRVNRPPARARTRHRTR